MNKNKLFLKRQRRVRGSIKKDVSKVRLSVYRSNKYIYAQIIDDEKGVTVLSSSDVGKKKTKEKMKLTKKENAFTVGEDIAKKAVKKGIKEVVFDRSGYRYHGRVKSVAEGARKAGLNF